MYVFRWNDWSVDHIAEHGVTPEEAEYVVNHAHRPYPQRRGGGRYLVVGQLLDGTDAQVAFIFSPPGVVFVIHSRPLTDIEKRRFRRKRQP